MRRVRFRQAVVVAALGVATTTASASWATASRPVSAHSPTTGRVGLWYAGNLLSPTVVADASGNGSIGKIINGGSGRIVSATDTTGNRFLRFPGGSCPVAPCPQAIIELPRVVGVPNGPFAFGADVRLTAPAPVKAGMNVIQFGFATASASQWKLQVDYGRPTCRWSDGSHSVLVAAGIRLTPGRWYRLICNRLSPSEFQIRVDDPLTGGPVVPAGRITRRLGYVLPRGKITIGGKRVGSTRGDTSTDQFHGDLDNIVVGQALRNTAMSTVAPVGLS